jgi:hypothetical protein
MTRCSSLSSASQTYSDLHNLAPTTFRRISHVALITESSVTAVKPSAHFIAFLPHLLSYTFSELCLARRKPTSAYVILLRPLSDTLLGSLHFGYSI